MESSRLQQILDMLEAEPGDSFLQYALALELEKSGKPLEAISRLEQLLQENPSYTGGYYKLGQLYEQTQQHSKAVDCYQKGIELTRQLGQVKAQRELTEALQQLEDF
jgi:tetratricopeptide (TPR) repeat protein